MIEKKQAEPKKPKKWRKKILFVSFFFAATIALLVIAYEDFYHKKPILKQAEFTFAYGETIPTNSDYYLRYGEAYTDIDFDKSQFQMREIGDYQVNVTFDNQAFVLHIHIIDKQPPIITFVEEQETIAYRCGNQSYFDTLFEIEDESKYTYDVTTKDSEKEENRKEICVSATDAFQNQSKACKSFSLQYVDLDEFENLPDYASVEALVQTFMQEKKLNETSFGFYFVSMHDNEEYIYNKSKSFNAASIIKLPMNMLYYDAFKNGTQKKEDTITLLKQDIEPGGGFTSIKHKINEKISVNYLLEQSIVYSDNTASNMLIRNLGGFYKFRKLLEQYTSNKLAKDFYYQNVVTMEYMREVMKHLYNDKENYQELIEHMKQANEGEYLKQSSDVFPIAQKYGSFEKNLHATGIVFTPKPYIVGIFTYDRADALELMKELNKRLMNYQLHKNLEISKSEDSK